MSPGKPKGRKNNNSPDGLQQLDITGASPADNNFPVVALGASAGGLEAFTQFLTALTHESGIAYVLIQHLDPSHPSSLVDLLDGNRDLRRRGLHFFGVL